MEFNRCYHCMTPRKPGEMVCPSCGHVHGQEEEIAFALRPGTILERKYVVGSVIGQGGFGITYVGFDMLLQQKVAIKEYFPMSTGMVARDNYSHSTVFWSKNVMQKNGQQRGFDSFLKEARKMARLSQIPNVVGVKTVFVQNETAYIVMEFIEGENLKSQLMKNGAMKFGQCVELLTPVMKALEVANSFGIIHRDISPDNLMIQPDGSIQLLDLGAAKDLEITQDDGSTHSSQLVAKAGFSPLEQYMSTNNTGSWTDVYAMCATIYYCCTGKLPPLATDRLIQDGLTSHPALTGEQFAVLSKGMAIYPKDRIKTMGELLDALEELLPKPQPQVQIVYRDREPEIIRETVPAEPERIYIEKKTPMWKRAIAVTAAAALCAGTFYLGRNSAPEQREEIVMSDVVTTAPPTEPTTAPAIAAEAKIDEGIESGRDSVIQETEAPASTAGNVMGSFPDTGTYFWGQTRYTRESVESIKFMRTRAGAAKNAFDISENQDGSILAWMDRNVLNIASNRKIILNANSSYLFSHFENLTSIQFAGCIDTSAVENMQGMFSHCTNLTKLDLDSFDTSNVITMSYMFNGCRSLNTLDLHSFNTENVRNMTSMFRNCRSLTSLDLSSFTAQPRLTASMMFTGCPMLRTPACEDAAILKLYQNA